MEEVSEAELVAEVRAGRVLDCGDGGRRPLDASLLRRCCHELRDEVDPRGIRLRNVAIAGSLDLAGMVVPFGLRFDQCKFDSPVMIEGAQLYELAMTRCDRLPGLLANGVRISRDLDLSGTRVTATQWTNLSNSKRAAVWLCEADIGGRLVCDDADILADGQRSIQADRMRIGGTADFRHQFTARGDMRLLGVRINGSLDFTGAHILSPAGQALDLNDAVIGGSVFLVSDAAGRRPVIMGRIDMSSARISGQFLVRNATLEGPAITPADSGYARSRARGTAVSAPRLSIGAELTLEESCQVIGGIDLSMSELSSVSIGPGCSLRAPDHTVLDLTNAELLAAFTVGERVPVEGTIRLAGARIRGNLCLQGAILTAPEDRHLIAAQGVKLDGELQLQDLEATDGDLGFRAASIGSVIDASGARLRNPGGYTLNLNQASIRGSVRLVDFESVGKLVLNRSTIEGRFICARGSLHCPRPSERNSRGHALEAIASTIRGGMDLSWKTISPSIDLTNTTTSFLADDPAAWPERYIISGFTYDRFERPQEGSSAPVWDHAARRTWLNRQADYDSGPYEHAARVFRQHGYINGARAILIAQRRQARNKITGRLALPRRALDAAYDFAVAYGYRPGRVLWALALLITLVAGSLLMHGPRSAMRAETPTGIVYTIRGPLDAASSVPPGTSPAARNPLRADACGGGQVRCFNPVLYAVDTVVPLISLDQRSTWYADAHAPYGTAMQWWLNAAAVLGWLLSSIFVLSLASLARSL